jgi:hypothetical protein
MNQPIEDVFAVASQPIPEEEIRMWRTLEQIRMRKLLPRAAITLLAWASLVFTSALICVSKAQAQAPTIIVTPTTLQSESKVAVTGTGLADETIVLWLDTNGNGQLDVGESTPIATFVADSNGSLPIDAGWQLHDVPAGSFAIDAGFCAQPLPGLCFGATSIASTPITVNLGVSTHSFGSGTTVTVTGFGFSPNATANVWFDGNLSGDMSACDGILPSSACSTAVTTDARGAFSTPLRVNGMPGDHYIHASNAPATTPLFTVPISIGSCWFQECIVDNVDTICFLGVSPSLSLPGFPFSDCKQLDSSYTNSPSGYDLTNTGPVFGGAGLLAAAVADVLQSAPGGGSTVMAAALAKSAAVYGNSGPDDASLLAIASLQTIGICPLCVGPLDQYIGALEFVGDTVPDKDLIKSAVKTLEALGPVAAPAAGEILAEAAIAGSIACGYVNYYCYGSDITKTILEHPSIQPKGIPVELLQAFRSNSLPHKCPNPGPDCWGGLIGWGQVACSTLAPNPMCCTTAGCSPVPASGMCADPAQMLDACEQPGNSSMLPIAGSVAAPANNGAPLKCTTGKISGLSIGYDGDISFDVFGPSVLPLVNYHNFQQGPGGTEPPNGIDIESSLADRPQFIGTFAKLRPGMEVSVCGRWVADMNMLWNELHPLTSISILPDSENFVPSAAWIIAVVTAPMLDDDDD